jgi:hypothetical protein
VICKGNQFIEIISRWKEEDSQAGGGVGGGVIAGITIGAVALVVVVAFLAFCIGRKCTNHDIRVEELESRQQPSYVNTGWI